jgi:hypothetical protein
MTQRYAEDHTNNMRGKLWRTGIYSIACALCSETESSLDAGVLLDYKEAVDHFRGCGWRFRRKVGWVCPTCVGDD